MENLRVAGVEVSPGMDGPCSEAGFRLHARWPVRRGVAAPAGTDFQPARRLLSAGAPEYPISSIHQDAIHLNAPGRITRTRGMWFPLSGCRDRGARSDPCVTDARSSEE
ncbi:hypothetical protein Pta02_25950 [Planobispora takensis]|uniref:Uncharacterized protein n=1 Tax=Planobispora takensis TaxID=1367882 RepID=A0A8J3SU65_9ACTN|nr:hypothetical protein Pta02_25950 [Planobispora takensis]